MQLACLIKSLGLCLSADTPNLKVKGITSDSRRVKADFIFVAVKGEDVDGHAFIAEAIYKGAKVIISQVDNQRLKTNKKIIFIKVADTRLALAKLVAQFYGQPSRGLKVIGITGTNGKTTVSYLIEAILRSAHFNPAVIGTINYRFGNRIFKANNTTPGPEQLQPLLAKMKTRSTDYVVIEVSSHALVQARVEAVKFLAAIFTNLTPDHLDYHRDLNSYFAAKSKLFSCLEKGSLAILNLDDSHSHKLVKLTKARIVTYGISDRRADITAQELAFSIRGTEFFLHFSLRARKIFALKQVRLRINTSLIGKHNVYNILAAVAFGLSQAIGPKIIRAAIEGFRGVPGRLEKIPRQKEFSVFVDYAHTEDAIINVIKSLRPLCKGRLCVVFGCGGNRDKTKRPRMGKAVSKLADLAIITTDNPRNEKPEGIIGDILRGIKKQNYKVIINRRQAIKEALSQAGNNDIILIAGKGHEDYQIFKNRKVHFDDRQVIREYLSVV
ncbi:MAG: UDP-N-acetylmuramoyl-L-alanyl-D-glutamate--2,6-diaminopimelate ligase [Candidatus Omnitrophota bacterium]|jgi:UDP-N-acetylmuramoyl-L-alanyl-D-glutamate--2,6-diaminopimelate ligase